jgi:hypothetical protein
VVAVIVAWQMTFFESGAAKAYRAHTKAAMERGGFSDDLVSPAKWDLEIESCDVAGDRATIRAIVKSGTIPRGAASLAFATIITRTVEVEMEKGAGGWKVAEEKVLDKDISTYEDREDSQLGR